MDKDIKLFIKKFNIFGNDVVECFTKGNCFYFAIILSWKYKDLGAEIVYNQIIGHFACKINSKIYDITGSVKDDGGWVELNRIKREDPSFYSRLIRDCT